MESIYIEGVERCKHDEKINTLVKNILRGPEGGGHQMTIAIQNESGEVYRVLTVWGLGHFMRAVQGLLSMRMVDLYAEKFGPKDYDCLFAFA